MSKRLTESCLFLIFKRLSAHSPQGLRYPPATPKAREPRYWLYTSRARMKDFPSRIFSSLAPLKFLFPASDIDYGLRREGNGPARQELTAQD
ncbi:MAG: hypothetical protein A3J74_09375 [Elusimicrobia bacterium RIFCSPHIGHO2_02_FULL_57_9]|nr:MAG: hypothetical protein A3J74_09375 [Elusimicrobia bacterium RIFCSPHIGHO2_02_FULL_57_9]